MKRKILIVSLISLTSFGLISAAIAPNATEIAKAGEVSKVELTSAISATYPGQGETISILPEGSQKYWELNDIVNNYPSLKDEIAQYTTYTSEQTTWTAYGYGSKTRDPDKLIELFNKYDHYHPVNNKLVWTSSLENVKNFHVIISQDSKMKTIEEEYLLDASCREVTFEYPYTGVTYYWQVNAILNDDSMVFSDIFTFNVAQSTRVLNIEGVSNTRDVGGYMGVDNNGNKKRTLQGMLYRGNRLEDASTLGASQMKDELCIKSDLDLRNAGEGLENPLTLDKYLNVPFPYECTSFALAGDNPDYKAYINYFGKENLVQNIGNAIKYLGDPTNYPVYFHCSVGRDRTGFLSFLVNALCGVSLEDIYKEYIYSIFSTSGAFERGTKAFYIRLNNIINLLYSKNATTQKDVYSGSTLAEKVESYLITHCNVTHQDCVNLRNVMFGDPVISPKANENSFEGKVKVTFKQIGKKDIVSMVTVGEKLTAPSVIEKGAWYNGDTLWNFATDTVSEDTVLTFKDATEIKITIRFSGISRPDEMVIAHENDVINFSSYVSAETVLKVYDEQMNTYTNSYTVTNKNAILTFHYVNGIGPVPAADVVKIIVMAGQSNAGGVGRYYSLANTVSEDKLTEYAAGFDNVYLRGYSHNIYFNDFDNVYCDKYYQTIGGIPSTFGFEVPLAEHLSSYFPDETIYIAKTAYGGCSLNYDFRAPSSTTPQIFTQPVGGVIGESDLESGWMFRKAVKNVKEIAAHIKSLGKVPSVEALVWMEGESESGRLDSANIYYDDFKAFVSDFKKECGDLIAKDFITIDGAISSTASVVPGKGQKSGWAEHAVINAAKSQFALETGGVFVDSNDWTNTCYTTNFEPRIYTHEYDCYAVDWAHYDATSYLELGHSFATAYIQHKDPTYKQHELRIGTLDNITISLSEGKAYVPDFITTYDGATVRPFYSFEGNTPSLFTVNSHGCITPIKAGVGELRVSVQYKDEVNIKVIDVTVTA